MRPPVAPSIARRDRRGMTTSRIAELHDGIPCSAVRDRPGDHLSVESEDSNLRSVPLLPQVPPRPHALTETADSS